MRRILLLCCIFQLIFVFAAVSQSTVENQLPQASSMQAEAQLPQGLQIAQRKPVRGYQQNPITITSPMEGYLTLTLQGNGATWRTIANSLPVTEGENVILWDGLGEWLQRLDETEYRLHAVLLGENGVLQQYHTIKLEKCAQALVYAMSTADVFTPGENWGIEYDLIRDGTIVLECYEKENSETPVCKRKINGVGKSVRTFKWDGKSGGKLLPDGLYTLRLYAQDNPYYCHEFDVKIMAKSEQTQEISPTGSIMPDRNATDDEIWQKMMLPSVVVDLKTTSHLKCYAQKNTSSAVLGTFHGQSQALQVLSCDGKWAYVTAWNHEEGEKITGYVEQSKLKVVVPRPTYGLLIDKVNQKLVVFKSGERLAEMKVSTGLVEKGKRYQETAAGSFLTQEHMSDFSTNGNKYDYVIRYDGGNLLHQSPYRMEKDERNYSAGLQEMGKKASHGCIRIQPFPDEPGGLNAYWLFTHIPKGTRVIVLDDMENRTAQAANVEAQRDAFFEPVEKQWETPEGNEEVVNVTLGGDAVLGTREKWMLDDDAFPAVIEKKGLMWPFSGLLELFRKDDITFINLEGVLKDDRSGENKSKEYRFRGKKEYAQILKNSSVEIVNIANNHIIDYGENGMEETIRTLSDADIRFSGYEHNQIMQVNGRKIGFGGCRETVYKKTPQVIRQDILQLKEMGAQVVVYACHWGTEYSGGHNELQQRMARACVEAGADLIVGTHPHVVQGIGEIDGVPILWSLGNLVFGGTKQMKTFDAMLAQVQFLFNANGYKGCMINFLPVLTSSSAPENNYHPVLAQGPDRDRIMKKIQADTAFALRDEMFFPKK